MVQWSSALNAEILLMRMSEAFFDMNLSIFAEICFLFSNHSRQTAFDAHEVLSFHKFQPKAKYFASKLNFQVNANNHTDQKNRINANSIWKITLTTTMMTYFCVLNRQNITCKLSQWTKDMDSNRLNNVCINFGKSRGIRYIRNNPVTIKC